MTTFAPFTVIPQLTAITLAYKNRSYIADSVLPRLPVGKQAFTYFKLAKGDEFTIPNTLVGRTSQTNEVERSATSVTDSTIDYGLQEKIPLSDIENAYPGYDPLGLATEQVTELIALAREQRTASLVFNSSSYNGNNYLDLTAASGKAWSDAAGVPMTQIIDAMDSVNLTMRPNTMVIGRKAYSALVRNVQIVKAYHGNIGDSGMVPKQFLKDLLELDNIFVGESFVNTVKKGKTPVLDRCWGNYCALIYQNGLAASNGGTSTFGFTAEFGSRVAGSWQDIDIGLRGGTIVRVGESVKELICADDMGYLFKNVYV